MRFPSPAGWWDWGLTRCGKGEKAGDLTGSRVAAPPKQVLASSIQESAWGMGHCDCVHCQGIPGTSGAWGYLCQTFSDRACYLSPLITVVLTWRCALPPSPGDMEPRLETFLSPSLAGGIGGGELGCYWYLVARTFYNAQGSPPQQRTIWPQMSVLSQMRHRVL